MIARYDIGRLDLKGMATRWAALVLVGCGLLCGGVANATTVYVSPGMPDIGAGGIIFDYGDQYGGGRSNSGGAGDFRLFQTTDGLPTSYIDPTGASSNIYLGTLEFVVGIDAVRGIDPTAVAANTVDGLNNIRIRGKFTLFGGTVTDLLTATISLLKDPTDNLSSLQFVANVTGGALASAYGGIGGEFVVFANAGGIGGPWTGTTFVVDGGSADFAAALVPVPGTLALLLLGIAVIRRRLISPGAGRATT